MSINPKYPHLDDEENSENDPKKIEDNDTEEDVDISSDLKTESFSEDQKVYWTEEQEEAIRQFLVEEDQARRDLIFSQKLYKPLNKLIENIIFTYKLFRPDVDIKTLQGDCLSFMMTKFSNFEPEQNHKAFSFFGTIAKHYLMCVKKEMYKVTKNTVDYESNQEEANNNQKYEITDDSHLDKSSRLFNHILKEIRSEIERDDISDNDRKVGDAIINIFENHEVLSLYNKNVLYQIIKERTGLGPKEITYSLSRFRVFYRVSKQSFNKKEK